MKIKITGGLLEAELEGNSIESIKSQLQQAIQKQDEDIATLGSHINESVSMIHRVNSMIAKQISDKSREEIASLQEEVSQAISALMEMQQNNPEIQILNDKIKKLSAITKSEETKIKELKAKVGNMAKPKTITKTITKTIQSKDRGIEQLNNAVRNIYRVPVTKYPKSEIKVRQGIMQADKPVHSSDSGQIGKLNAVPRMPI